MVRKAVVACSLLILIGSSLLMGGQPRREVNLRGRWHFEIGDNPEYADPAYDDSGWEKIRVPDQWEDQGFPGYDGCAWYRTTFEISDKLKNKVLYLNLGYIDDVDKVYINGHFINGRGSDAPNYVTAYNHRRYYQIPGEVLHYGKENTLAVRVYDEWGAGGIVSGKIGIYSQNAPGTTLDLTGNWQFRQGDNPGWASDTQNASDWSTVVVPGFWESQGFPELDGYGWYRKNVTLPSVMKNKNLILFIGAIDDADEVYFNGHKIGSKGKFPGEAYLDYNRRFYNQERFYTIPGQLIQWGQPNIIAVRVYDSGADGGIYRGPVGITTREEFGKFRKLYKDRDITLADFIDELLDF